MKKREKMYAPLQKRWRQKILLLMKNLCIFLFVFNFGLSAATHAQNQRVSVDLKQATIEDLIVTIKRQCDVGFLYDYNKTKTVNNITVQLKDKLLSEVLQKALAETNFFAEIENNTIIIREKPQLQEEKRRVVQGIVTDSQNVPLPGVTVMVKGMSIGVTTNAKGYYKITLLGEKETSLVFSFVGMASKEIKVTNQQEINVVLEEEATSMEEVVVTGYQVLKEKGMAGSYSKIKAEDLVMTGNENIETMLQGKLPGMMVINQSGLTGTRQKVRVRGTSTLVGNAEPVWVVDGIIQEDNLPFESSQLGAIGDDNLDMMKNFVGGAISWLNPNDIEDITVLKDAAATAIYGVKAANGVILITTKKGERGSMSVNYAGNFTVGQRMNYERQEVMNSQERVDLSREAFKRGARMAKETFGYSALAYDYTEGKISWDQFNTEAKKLETSNTDWFDLLYCTPFSQSHSVSFSKGSNDATYRVSIGYQNVQNSAKGNEQESFTGSLNTSMVFWKKLTLTAGLSGSHVKTTAFASGVDPFNYAIKTSRVLASHDEEGELFYYDKSGYRYNILNELANSGNENVTKSVKLNVNARWRLTEDFAFSATLGGSSSSAFAETWFTERSNYITSIRGYEFGEYGVLDEKFQDSRLPYGGMLTVNETRNFNYTARLQAEYVKLFNGVHSVNVMAGAEVRSNEYKGFSQTNWGYQPDRGKSFVNVPAVTPSGLNNQNFAATNPIVTDKIENYVSYYATAGYMYDNRYSINLSMRGDASNAFGENVKFQPVWSLAMRWNVTDEHWMQNQKMVNNLALRASLGYQGNVVGNVSSEFIAKMLPVDENTGEYRMTWYQLPNPDLKPEKTLSIDLGVDFALFNNKVNGTFNWYYKKTTDLVSTTQVPYETGTASMDLNEGSMVNKGWDLAFTVVPVRTKNFMWSVGTSFSGNDNEVESNVQKNGNWQNAVTGELNKKGYPVGSFWAFRFQGLDAQHGGPLFDLSRANTSTAAADATEYMVYAGTLEPKFTMGLNMVFRWKRFSFPLNVYVSRGNHQFLASPYSNGYMMPYEYQNASSELNDRWRQPGDEVMTNIPSIPVGENCRPLYPFEDGTTALYPLDAWKYSDARVVSAWYVRFNDLRLTYDLPDKWIKGLAKRVAISFTATNPLQFKSKDFKGRDPEVATGQQPRSQNYTLGINMSF